jgi:hypothetical protein
MAKKAFRNYEVYNYAWLLLSSSTGVSNLLRIHKIFVSFLWVQCVGKGGA